MTRRSREYALSLHIRSDPKNLSRVRREVFRLARRAGFKELLAKKIALAIDEACANIIRHTYQNDHTQPILIRGIQHGDRLEFRLRDFGKKVNPAAFPARSLEEIRPGGLGLALIRQIMDHVEFDTSVTMGTEMCLVKLKPPQAKVRKGPSDERRRRIKRKRKRRLARRRN